MSDRIEVGQDDLGADLIEACGEARAGLARMYHLAEPYCRAADPLGIFSLEVAGRRYRIIPDAEAPAGPVRATG